MAIEERQRLQFKETVGLMTLRLGKPPAWRLGHNARRDQALPELMPCDPSIQASGLTGYIHQRYQYEHCHSPHDGRK